MFIYQKHGTRHILNVAIPVDICLCHGFLCLIILEVEIIQNEHLHNQSQVKTVLLVNRFQ